jgi:hypothetical protein
MCLHLRETYIDGQEFNCREKKMQILAHLQAVSLRACARRFWPDGCLRYYLYWISLVVHMGELKDRDNCLSDFDERICTSRYTIVSINVILSVPG